MELNFYTSMIALFVPIMSIFLGKHFAIVAHVRRWRLRTVAPMLPIAIGFCLMAASLPFIYTILLVAWLLCCIGNFILWFGLELGLLERRLR